LLDGNSSRIDLSYAPVIDRTLINTGLKAGVNKSGDRDRRRILEY